jgi:hypothetical protein
LNHVLQDELKSSVLFQLRIDSVGKMEKQSEMREIDESLMWYHGSMSRQMCEDVLVAGNSGKISPQLQSSKDFSYTIRIRG